MWDRAAARARPTPTAPTAASRRRWQPAAVLPLRGGPVRGRPRRFGVRPRVRDAAREPAAAVLVLVFCGWSPASCSGAALAADAGDRRGGRCSRSHPHDGDVNPDIALAAIWSAALYVMIRAVKAGPSRGRARLARRRWSALSALTQPRGARAADPGRGRGWRSRGGGTRRRPRRRRASRSASRPPARAASSC